MCGGIDSTVSRKVIENATKLRAKYNILTPDAIQISSSMQIENETIFLTSDKTFKKVPEITVLMI